MAAPTSPTLNTRQSRLVRDVAAAMLRLSDVASAVARSDAAEASRHLAAVEMAVTRLSRRIADLDEVDTTHDLHLYL